MYFDGINLAEGSDIVNLTVASGIDFPNEPSLGELFYKTSSPIGLYVYNSSSWEQIAETNSIASTLTAGTGIDITNDIVSLESGIVGAGTYRSITTDSYGRVVGGTNPTTLSGFGITDSAPLSHVSDETVHLTSAQNSWIDGVTATSTEVNHLVGVTSGIQTQLGNKLSLTGGTMTGNLIMQSSTFLTLNSAPVNGTDAANKAYVDALATGLIWKSPVNLVNLVGSATSPIGSPATLDAYIIDTGGATGAWSSFAVGDVVQWSGTAWAKVRTLTIGDRYGVAFYNETTPTGLLASKMLQIATITNATPGSLAATYEVPAVGNAVYIGDPGAALFGRSYTYVASTAAPTGDPNFSWIQFSGPGSTVAGTGLYYSGNILHVGLGAGIKELPNDEVGIDVYATGGLMTTSDGTTSDTTTNAQLSLTKVGTAGTYTKVTTDDKGRVISGSNPTTLAGYGITDASSGQMYGSAAVKAIFFNSTIISEDLTIATNQNGLTAGPVTIADGYTVTISDGSVWSIV